VWFTEAAIAAWRAEPRCTRGGQPRYSALAITTALTLRAVFGNYAFDVPPKSRYINSNLEACDDRQSHRSDLQQRGSR
jgi:hypothetical protein